MNVLRQRTARRSKISMENLSLRATWASSADGPLQIKIEGLLLQGAEFVSGRLTEASVHAPELKMVPPVTIEFVSKSQLAVSVAHESSILKGFPGSARNPNHSLVFFYQPRKFHYRLTDPLRRRRKDVDSCRRRTFYPGRGLTPIRHCSLPFQKIDDLDWWFVAAILKTPDEFCG